MDVGVLSTRHGLLMTNRQTHRQTDSNWILSPRPPHSHIRTNRLADSQTDSEADREENEGEEIGREVTCEADGEFQATFTRGGNVVTTVGENSADAGNDQRCHLEGNEDLGSL